MQTLRRLDRAGRRSCGLDDSERNQNINIGMQLIEYRLANISLPPDAPHASSNPFLANGQDVTEPRVVTPHAPVKLA